MKKSLQFTIILLLLCAIFVPVTTKAVNATESSPVLFNVRGSATSGVIRYDVVVLDIYVQTYQSWTITYPSELTIQNTSALSTDWNISTQIGPPSGNSSASFILKPGKTSKSPSEMQTILQTIYFVLTTTDVFPPNNSKVAISAFPTKVTFFQDDRGYAHWYQFITWGSAMNWMQAYNAARALTMQDPRYPTDPSKKLQGYLATITNEEEQKQIYSAIATQCGWLGGTRMVKSPGNAKIQDDLTIGTTTGSFNTGTGTTDGYVWYWACGPEAWTTYNSTTGICTYHPRGTVGVTPLVFFDKPTYALSGKSPLGTYNNFNNPNSSTIDPNKNLNPVNGSNNFDHFFNSNAEYVGRLQATGGEPNNSGTEYCMQFAYVSGTKTLTIPAGQPNAGTYTNTNPDTWNDFPATTMSNMFGYYVEFGGYPDDPLVEELSGSDVTTSSEVELVLPVIIQYRSTVKNSLNNYQVITSIGTLRDSVLNYEQFLPYTALRNQTAIPGYTAYGYDFIGQQEDRDNLTVDAAGNVSGFFSPYSQRIVFLYKPNELTVFFDANFSGATSANVSATEKTVYFDSPYGTLPIATRMGYEFAGWLSAPTVGKIIEPDTMVKTQTNHTLYAQWQEKNGYTVKYDENFATSGPILDKTNVSWGDANLLPAEPVRTGYVFMGWNVSVNGSKQGVSNSDKYGDLPFSDQTTFVTLKAQWALASVYWVVIYHTNGSTSPVSLPNDSLPNNTTPIQLKPLVKTGYTFGGWYIENNGAGGTDPGPFINGDTVITFATHGAGSENFIILGAIWTPKTYTVNYDLNYVSAPTITPVSGVLWEQTGLVPAPGGTPERTGYLFMGWNTLPGGGGNYIYSGDSYATIVNGADTKMDTTLYAQWMAERTYFVRYALNGASSPDSIPDKTGVLLADGNLLPTVPILPPIGFDFVGWEVSYNGTKQGVTNADKFGELATDPNYGFIILKAMWMPKANYTVKYDGNGGGWTTPPANKTGVVWTQTHLIPAVEPLLGGQVFVGWNTQANGLGIIATNAATYGYLANNDTTVKFVTLYAQWALASVFTVRYDVGIGSGTIPNKTLTARTDTVPAPIPIAPVGHQFLDWKVDDNGYGQGTTMIANGSTTFNDLAHPSGIYITLLAEYVVKKTYTIIYHHHLPDTLILDTLEGVKWTGQSNFVPFPVSNPGFSLLGWTTKENGSGITVLPSHTYSTLTVGLDIDTIVLYAQWEKGSFTVRYDMNGGVPPHPEDYEQRTVGFDDTNLVPPSFARAGYVLTQWNVSENGFGLDVKSTDRYRDLANTGVQYITIQAQWGEKEYKVLYDENGSIDTYLPQTGVRWWSNIEYPLVDPTPPPGYISFLGWKLSAIGTTPTEIDDEPFLTGAIKFGDLAVTDEVTTTSITLQAQYEEGPNVTIKYWVRTRNSASPASGGTISNPSETLPPATGVATGSIATPNPGYHFVGWYAVDDTTTYHPSYIITPSLAYTPLKVGGVNIDTTYVALFEENSNVTITYAPKTVGYPDTQGGNVAPLSQSVKPATGNPSATAIENPGYHLVGWFSAANIGFTDTLAKTLNFNPPRNTDGIFVDSAYIALFTENDSVVIAYIPYNLNILDPSDGGTLSKGTKKVAPATGTVTGCIATPYPGYHFVGWFLSGSNYNDLNDTLTTAFQYVPQKNANNIFETATYVAVFEENDSVVINYQTYNLTTLTFNTGGTVSPGSEKVAPASSAAMGATATPAHGYQFVGWYSLGADYTDIDDTLSTKLHYVPEKNSNNIYEDTTYVAVFIENDSVVINYQTYNLTTLTFSTGGTVSPGSEKVAPATGTPAGATATPAHGYHFVGWYSLGADYTDIDDTLSTKLHYVPEQNSNNIYEDTTYIAVFEENDSVVINYQTYNLTTLTFNTGGTVSPGSEKVAPATSAAMGATATPAHGYQFVGWYSLGADYTDIDDTLSTQLHYLPEKNSNNIYEDTTYVAVFIENDSIVIKYQTYNLTTLTFNTGGTVSPGSEKVAPATGTPAGATATPAHGYHFVGWYLFGKNYSAITDTLSTMLHFVPEKNSNNIYEDTTYIAVFAENDSVVITYLSYNLTTLAFNTGGTVSINSEKVAPATSTAMGATATPAHGYHFVGWYSLGADYTDIDDTLSTKLHYLPEKNSNNIYEDTTYIAVFEENDSIFIKYQTYNLNTPLDPNAGGTVSINSEKLPPATGTTIGSTATPDHGYHFVGWYLSGTNYTDIGDTLSTKLHYVPEKNSNNIYEDTTYIAVFAENDSAIINYQTYNLTTLAFNTGGTVSINSEKVAPATGSVTGSTATPALGYHFVGWYSLGADYTDIDDTLSTMLHYLPEQNSNNIYEDTTYVAVFAENDSVIINYAPMTLNGTPAQGGSVSPTSEKVAPATGTPTGSTATPNPGYHLVGWFYATDLSYTTNLGTALTFTPPKIGGLNVDSNYVAVFAENDSVTITYTTATTHGLPPEMGGSVSPTSQKVAPATGTASSTASPNPGFNFVGWFYASDISFSHSLGSALTFNPPKIGGLNVDSSYVAQFTPKTGYVVVYDCDGGTTIPNKTVNWVENVLPATNPTKPNYIISGWEVIVGGPSDTLPIIGNRSYGSLAYNDATLTITLKAQWCVVTEPVIAATNNGIICSGTSVTLTVSNISIYSSSRYFKWYKMSSPDDILLYTGDSYTVSTPGTYYVLLVDGVCWKNSSKIVIITGTDPEPPILDVTNGGYICNNGNVVLSVTNTTDYSSKATYQWYETTAPAKILGTNSYLSVGKAGNYNVIVTDDYCTAIAATPVVVYHNPTLPVPDIAASDGGYLEPGGSITLSVANKANYSGTETYMWFEEKDPTTILSTTDILTVTKTGLYHVMVTDKYCTTQNQFLVCPLWVADYEGTHYTITSLAGLCWTSNMATRHYEDGEPIAFARPYYSYLYPDTIANANIFGLLYTWYSAVGLPEGGVRATDPWSGFVQGICPLGWHIPTQQEWQSLLQYNIQDLKSENYWIDLSGLDKYEFTSLPAGLYAHTTESFINLYGETAYWSCGLGPNDPSPYLACFAYYCNQIIDKRESKSDGYSVRCVLDY